MSVSPSEKKKRKKKKKNTLPSHFLSGGGTSRGRWRQVDELFLLLHVTVSSPPSWDEGEDPGLPEEQQEQEEQEEMVPA